MILSATFSKPAKNCEEILGKPFKKIKFKPVNKDSHISYFAEMFTEKQVFHKTFEENELIDFIENHAGKTFLQCNYKTETEEITILGNKKGHISRIVKKTGGNFTAEENVSTNQNDLQKKFPLQTLIKPSDSNTTNRKKNYILQEGTPIPFLILLGIMSPAGKIISSKYDKFRQINRFLEFIDDIIDEVTDLIKSENSGEKVNFEEAKKSNQLRPIQITDFGCGKSYLTFAAYYYLTQIKNLNVNVVGLDLKENVINYCNNLAKQMNFSNLSFAVGNIADYSHKQNPDIIITLHACDTATDYALQYAVSHSAKAILSVPCCQHEINGQLDKNKAGLLAADSVYSSILRYGLLKERFSAIVTDAIRADFLEEKNYKVQILEFIDMEHTPKNLLIRAVKKPGISGDATSNSSYSEPANSTANNSASAKASKRIDLLKDSLNIHPSILK